MDAATHAARGALVSGGGLTLLQCVLARRPKKPSDLALSVGGFVGTFRLVHALSRKRDGDCKQDDRGTNASSVAAASAAVVAMAFLDAKRKGVIVAYAALEAAVLLLREHTALAHVKHIDVLVAMFAGQQIIYQWLFGAHLLTESQLATLDGMTLVPPKILARVRAAVAVDPDASRCELFHEGLGCTEFHMGFLQQHFRAASKLFLPIYLISAVLSKYDKWIWGPRPSAKALLLQYLRSCASLTLCFVVPLAYSCVSPIKSHRGSVLIAGILSGLTVFIEHEKRRASVLKATAVYPLTAWVSGVGGTLGVTKRGISLWQFFVFSVAMAVLLHKPQQREGKVAQLLYGRKAQKTAAAENQREDCS